MKYSRYSWVSSSGVRQLKHISPSMAVLLSRTTVLHTSCLKFPPSTSGQQDVHWESVTLFKQRQWNVYPMAAHI
jgi:hypothetical protein